VSAGLQNFCVLSSIWLKSFKKTFQLIEITQTCINSETPEGWKIAKYLENIYYFGQSFVKVNGGRA